MKYKNLLLGLCIIIATPVFSQNPDMSIVPYRQGDLWGYASPDKKIVITPAYEDAGFFSEGYAAVKKGGKYGYINKTGKLVIPLKFFVAKPFRIGYLAKVEKIVTADDIGDNQKTVLFAPASLRTDGYEICIDIKGVPMKGCPAMLEGGPSDPTKAPVNITEINYSTVKQNDIFDKIVGDYKIPGQEDRYYIAVKGTNYGVFNNKFEIIVPFDYMMIKKWEINNKVYLEVQKNEGKGLINGNGTVSIPVDNSNLTAVKAMDAKYYFIVAKNGKSGIKDAGNNDIVPSYYTDITYEPVGGFVLTGDNNLKGFRFLNNYTLEPKYTNVRAVRKGEYVIITTQAGKTGYINDKGDEFFVE